MRTGFKRVVSFLLILAFILTGFPSVVKSFAQPDDISLQVSFNAMTNKYEVSCYSITKPAKTEVYYHNPDGTLTLLEGKENYYNNRAIVSLDLKSDHIYDITMDVYQNPTDSEPAYRGKIYYLADITFTGESFNVMAKMADIEDNNPVLQPDVPGEAVVVKSGEHPLIRLKWKIPTIYSESLGKVTYLTSYQKEVLNDLSEPDVPIDRACFQISMTVGRGSNRYLYFNTDYDGSDMIIQGKDQNDDVKISNIINGIPGEDGFVSVVLDKEQGIEPGTEYAYTDIGIIFKNDESDQIPIRRTKLQTDSNNRFLVRNVDNAFADIGHNLSSIFTPMQMEITKVDTDKVEVKFKKITNGVYPQLYYQVQYASRIDDLYTQSENWVKIPDVSLPVEDEYGSEIITINIPETTHPEYYFRVVYYDSSSVLPRNSSLCINLQLLGIDTGKPPLPKEVKVDPIYAGRKKVVVPDTELSQGEVEIALSDLRLSFEKPIAWRGIEDWEAFKNMAYTDDDFTFHIILSTLLPDVEKDETPIKNIGLDKDLSVYMPVKQKRVLVLGKKDFTETPDGRLMCTIPGDKLFYDYVSDKPLTNENNEDPSEDGIKGDYPEFLIPNTTYYMQIFTSRLKDNLEIDNDVWGDQEGLSSDLKGRISFISPILSFTTWPLSEQPVPMPDIILGTEPATNVDPVTGDIFLEGISVSFERILNDADWLRYTSVDSGKEIQYSIFISRNPTEDFELAQTLTVEYPVQELVHNVVIKNIVKSDGSIEKILPNTVYYIKAHASLVVDGVVIGRSAETAVKAITTPKIDSGGLEDITRNPRAPSEFSIAVDEDGQLILSDAFVTLNWLHAERDVTYEMICTSVNISPDADVDEYKDDPYNFNFLEVYDDFREPQDSYEIHLDVNSSKAINLGLTVNESGKVTLPVDRDFLRPNRTYFFSLRAVRNRDLTDEEGKSIETVSRWVTVPVTTKMVEPPAFIEAVRDVEIGFNIQCYLTGATADSMQVYIKKAGASDYVHLNRSQFTCVKDGATFYFRIYNLESDQWYDIRVKNTLNDSWYDGRYNTWRSYASNPIQVKTRDNLSEIEVRWEGRDPYDYFLEIRTDYEVEYRTLSYRSSGQTDYGYDLPDGSRIRFYREKTNLYVQENSPKYIYYAKITSLRPNTDYYVKLWAYNLEESLHIGPVTARTDFSQKDYDEGRKKDEVIDLFDKEAEGLTNKLYWLYDKKDNGKIRAIIKDDKVSGLLKVAQGSTVTVDFTNESSNVLYYEVLIPYKTLEVIENYDSRLNIKLEGAEITLNRGSIDFEVLKKEVLTSNSKEAMILLTVNKTSSPDTRIPAGFDALSKYFNVDITAIGSRRTYQEINHIIHNILKNPDATGPFEYGILDRELTEILSVLERYSFRSQTDLKDLIKSVIEKVETELSKYLKDIIDGGSGYSPNFIVKRTIRDFPGRIGVKLEYTYQNGYIIPYTNYGSGWKEVTGAKAYVMQYVLFRAEKPGQYAVFVRSGSVIVQPDTPFEKDFSRLSSRYDLTKVFGTGTIYPENPISGNQAVMLFAVLTHREDDVMGATPINRVSILGLNDVFTPVYLNGYMDNQASLAIAVKLYCSKANINPDYMKPSRIFNINSSNIKSQLYKYVMLGLDLELIDLGEDMTFNAQGRTSIGMMLDMVSKVLEKFGEI
ncbi:MAG: hypothetical protein GX957_15425 [Clostridiaceae bacterium]|nr:hypothetical protein [Clostridiaceae bacterium]